MKRGVIGHVVLLVVAYLASFAFAKSTPLSREMTLWGWRDRVAARPAGAAD